MFDVHASGLWTKPLLLTFYLSVVWQSPGILVCSSSESTLQVREGATARLQCTAACQPLCYYRWVCTDCHIKSRGGDPVLTLPNVTRDHAGLYRCNAYNNGTHAHSTVRLHVLYPARVVELKFEKDASDEKLIVVTCRASGYPSPREITWEISNQSTQPKNTNILRLGQELTSSFTLVSTKCFKSDNFTCITTNGLDPPHHVTASFFVKCATAIDVSSCEPSDTMQTVRLLDTVDLRLCALAYPSPTVRWQQVRSTTTNLSISGYNLTYDTSFGRLKTELRVHVQTPDMYGPYQVLVENEMGVLSRTFILEAKEPPWPPQAFTSRDVTSTSACLSWTVGFDGGAPQTFLLRAKVDINDDDDEKTIVVVADKAEQRVESCVEGLRPHCNYTFLLIATNTYGDCPSTVVLNISTPPQTRLSQLLDSDVKEADDNNLLVDWMTPWVVKVVLAAVCLILLVAGGVVIATRRRREEKGTYTESQQSTVDSGTTSNNLLENGSSSENMYLTIQEAQSVYENEDDAGEITVAVHALPPDTQLHHRHGSEGPAAVYDVLLPPGEDGNGPVRTYDALLPCGQSAADDCQVLPPAAQYIDMTCHGVTPPAANDSDNAYVQAMPKA